MAKFNVGDKVRILDVHNILGGEEHWNNGDIVTVTKPLDETITDKTWLTRNKIGEPISQPFLHKYELQYVELVANKPRKSERINTLETEVAVLKAEVEALKQAKNTTINAPSVDEMIRLGKSVTLTPNERRADVIKRAKAFVADIIGERTDFTWDIGGYKNQAIRASFHVNTEKGAVTALIHGHYSRHLYAKGIAKCDPADVFNADIGKVIALGRALGLDVSEFEHAIQPTEVVVGMRAKVGGVREPYISTLVQNNVARGLKDNSVGFVRSNPQFLYGIVEDTDAVYE